MTASPAIAPISRNLLAITMDLSTTRQRIACLDAKPGEHNDADRRLWTALNNRECALIAECEAEFRQQHGMDVHTFLEVFRDAW